ncbi:MAG: nucleotidyltransferase family protein [Rhodobacter sp.]|nr:nucleotidyltransferase family protein [Rhodobacter sp.]MCY4241382.1 nucleotidyltransferase family protein [Rhodobacter sp.]
MVSDAILLLAAGSSARMRGSDKLLEEVDGVPILRRQAKAALATGAHVTVALAPNRRERCQTLAGLQLQRVVVENAARGMGTSIGVATAALPDSVKAVAILPADMPEITTGDLEEILAASASLPDLVVQGVSSSGVPGHPVVFPSRLFPMLTRLKEDEGGRSILEREKVHRVPLPEGHALTDLDTPEAWAAWRTRRTGSDKALN